MAELTLAQSRRLAREACMKYFFEKLVNNGMDNSYTYDNLLASLEKDSRKFFVALVEKIDERFDFLKSAISGYVRTYDVDRIYKIDLSILMIASYEIVFTDTPDKVAANEAIEIAKLYSTDNSPSFINGLLAVVIKNKAELIEKHESENN